MAAGHHQVKNGVYTSKETRDTSLQTNVNDEEKARIEEAASILGLPVAVYLRYAALKEHRTLTS